VRSETLRLGLEIGLLCLFFITLRLAVPMTAGVFIFVAEHSLLGGVPDPPLDRFGIDIYMVTWAVFAIPILILAGTGWALRRWVATLDE
jgi:hypothetical protein